MLDYFQDCAHCHALEKTHFLQKNMKTLCSGRFAGFFSEDEEIPVLYDGRDARCTGIRFKDSLRPLLALLSCLAAE